MEPKISNGQEFYSEGIENNLYELIDTTDLSDQRLCFFLSSIFLDTETDYKRIAYLARHYPLKYVEKLLFEWVAPVCYVNLMSVIPEIWLSFDADELWSDIQNKLKNEESPNIFKRFNIFIRDKYIRHRFNYAWIELQSSIARLDAELGTGQLEKTA